MDYYDKFEPEVFQRVVDIIGKPERVIEIGCGDCRLGNFIAGAIGCTVLGVDIDTQFFNSGKKQSKQLRVAHLVKSIKHNAEHLTDLSPPKFDCCVSIYVLHELEHPLNVLIQVHRVLRRKGKMVLIDFPKGSIAEELYDEEYYSARTMHSLLRKAGFKKISIEYFKKKQLALLIATV